MVQQKSVLKTNTSSKKGFFYQARFLSLLAYKDLINQKKYIIFFLLNATLGLIGPALLHTYRTLTQEGLDKRVKTLLGADLSLSARRVIPAELIEKAVTLLSDGRDSKLKYAKQRTLYTMISTPSQKNPKLVQLKSFEDHFPFYGQIKREDFGPADNLQSFSYLDKDKVYPFWAKPDVIEQFQIKPGELVRLGSAQFYLKGKITVNTTEGQGGFALAPQLLVHDRDLEKTQLVTAASMVTHSYFFQNPWMKDMKKIKKESLTQLSRSQNWAKTMPQKLFELFKKVPGVNVFTPSQFGANTGRMIKYFQDYLGLVSLVAFFLLGLGTSFLFFQALMSRKKEVAILRTIGMSPRNSLLIFVIQLMFLGILETLLTLGLVNGILFFLADNSIPFLGQEVGKSLPFETALLVFILATVSNFCWALPQLIKFEKTNTRDLFHSDLVLSRAKNTETKKDKFSTQYSLKALKNLAPWPLVFSYIPLFLFCFLLSLYMAHSVKVGGLFFAGALLSALFYIFGSSCFYKTHLNPF